MRKFAGILAVIIFLGAPASYAEKLTAKEGRWISTGSGNSLEPEAGLFTFQNGIISTSSESTNIHTHYSKNSLRKLKNYVFSGQLMISDQDGGIGITFHSDYPTSDTYYRLRRFRGEDNFHIAPHPDGVQLITSGSGESGFGPQAGRWHGFKIMVRTTRRSTRIRARIWYADGKEPNVWLLDCKDSSAIHIKSGRLGLWSAGPGTKSWRKLNVTLN